MTGRNFFGAAPLQARGVTTRIGAAEAEPQADTPAPGADILPTAKKEARGASGLRLQQTRTSGQKSCMFDKFHNKFGKLYQRYCRHSSYTSGEPTCSWEATILPKKLEGTHKGLVDPGNSTYRGTA